MKKFIAKQDVEKGLVDLTKPLKQQPQYIKKLEEEAKLKQPKKHKENNEQEKKPKKVRQDRPGHNWNKKQITLQTPVPEAPKKLLPKPDKQKFQVTLNKIRDQRDALYQLRKKLIDEQRILIKNNSQTKKGGFNALSKYSGELKQKNNLKNIIDGKIKKLEQQRNSVDQQIKQLKEVNGQLRSPKTIQKYTTQRIKKRIQQLQHKLSTANIDKKQETIINNDINASKRALLNANKNDDSIKILYDQLKDLKKQLDINYGQIKPLKKQIAELMQKKKQQSGTITQVRSIEQIKAQYDQKIKANDAKRQQLKTKMNQLRDKYEKQCDLYYDQQDLLKYIKYVQQEKQYKKKRQQQQQKRRKERQEQQKKKQKQFEQRNKKRQERKKQQQERQKRQQERRENLKNQRQKFINRNPNYQRVQVCEFMITYCQNLKPDNLVKESQQQKHIKLQELNLAKEKGWQKQAKSGCSLVIGKKDLVDQAAKKVKKEKKRKQPEEDGAINHNIDTINRFHDLNILPPTNISQLDQTIQQLKQKIEIYNKPSAQQIEKFKAKAQIQFDRIHGLNHEVKQQYAQKDQQEKPIRSQKKKEKSEKVELKGSDFPELN